MGEIIPPRDISSFFIFGGNIMEINTFFCLSGCGYLQQFYSLDNKMVAKIKMMINFDSATLTKDEVWVTCIVTCPEQQARLSELFKAVKAGCEVIVSFKARYSVFVFAYSGLTRRDPQHTLSLQSKLMRLEDCYIDGRLANRYQNSLKAIA